MRTTFHPPLLIAPPGAEIDGSAATMLYHAALWVVFELEAWQTVRSGHLHAVWSPGASSLDLVDLSRHPLQPWHGTGTDREDIAGELAALLDRLSLRFFRVPETHMVSEPGEGREAFRRRASGVLRPMVLARIEELRQSAGGRSPVPGSGSGEGAARLASELARTLAAIEELEVEGLGPRVRRAEVGELWLAPGVTLAPPRHRDPMV